MQETCNIGHTVFITGAAGYVGAMLVDQFSKREEVTTIIALDVEPAPDFLANRENVIWLQKNVADDDWQDAVREYAPDIVIHAAWHIREMYGARDEQWRWNVTGSENVFSFAFSQPSVQNIIHFSTAAVYGAYAENTIEHRFTEDEPMREEEYSYGVEKRVSEEKLGEQWEQAERAPAVSIVRPAAITGPRGRFMRVRFGLQSALSGKLEGSFVYKIIMMLVAFVPATPKWCRQFIHEDDVVDIIALLTFEPAKNTYSVFNIVPPGPVVRAKDMAQAVGKRVLPIYPWMVRLAFFVFWHATRGKIPTAAGSWRFYSYPIVMDGSKLSRERGYTYAYEGYDAFRKTAGRYEYIVPEEERR